MMFQIMQEEGGYDSSANENLASNGSVLRGVTEVTENEVNESLVENDLNDFIANAAAMDGMDYEERGS